MESKVSGVLTGRPAEAPDEPGTELEGEPGEVLDGAEEQAREQDLEQAALDAGADEVVAEQEAVTDVVGVPPATAVEDPHTGEPQPLTEPDALLAAAVELARTTAVEVGGAAVGEHLGVSSDAVAGSGPVATHAFASTDPAYVGWRWTVTLARAYHSTDSTDVTVDEVVLLPGDGALLAPAWVPWAERVEAGDLSPGDLLPPAEDDERLVASYAGGDAGDEGDLDLADAVWDELALGRPRVLSIEGRAEAAARWYEGDAGPEASIAKKAPGTCDGCGFLVPLGGALRATFGVCANAYAPDDGRVVALAHGCGAHSEITVDGAHVATTGMVTEEDDLELVASRDLG